ncbi:MAG TPA: BamA/TamA family outer membrane protein [Steroidobacteraceae bacterium]|nr:BamA/TamA family outer membrane protein [Steroidobacteraceae bacterium]
MKRSGNHGLRWLAALVLLSSWQLARADIEVVIEGVSEEIKRNLLVYLSLQRYRERDDLSDDTVDRLHERTPIEVRQALRPFGYYEPTVQANVEHLPNGRDWRVTLKIEPGPPVLLEEAKIEVTGPGAEESMFRDVIANSELKPGQRLNHGTYDQLRGDLQRTALGSGYLDARFARHELLVDPPSHRAWAYLTLETGQRYRFGATEIEQEAIDQELVRRYLRYREGDYFEAIRLLTTQFALDDTQYFSTVEITPGARDPQTLTVPVTIRAQPSKKNKYTLAVGYGTDTRFRGTIAWDNRRLNRKGHRSRVELLGSDKKQAFEAHYIIPVGDPALEHVGLDWTVSREELADLDVTSTEVTPNLTQIIGKWQRALFVTFERSHSESPSDSDSANFLMPGISFALLPASFSGESSLVLGRGLYAELKGSHSALGSDADFLRLNVQDERVFDLNPVWHLLLRGEIGLSAVADFSELPGSQRFFAGGDRSVRGFGLNELSPVDADGNRTGGRHLLVGSIEIERDLPRRFGVALFFDAGNAVNKLGDPVEYSVGVGFRWRIPVVTVGIDVAQALSQSDLGPRLHLNIQPSL